MFLHYRFAEKSHLARHYSFHSEERPYKCEVCQKMYKTERCLKVHSLVHAAARPFVCAYCSKGFLSSTKLKVRLTVLCHYRGIVYDFAFNFSFCRTNALIMAGHETVTKSCPVKFFNILYIFSNTITFTRARGPINVNTANAHLQTIPIGWNTPGEGTKWTTRLGPNWSQKLPRRKRPPPLPRWLNRFLRRPPLRPYHCWATSLLVRPKSCCCSRACSISRCWTTRLFSINRWIFWQVSARNRTFLLAFLTFNYGRHFIFTSPRMCGIN